MDTLLSMIEPSASVVAMAMMIYYLIEFIKPAIQEYATNHSWHEEFRKLLIRLIAVMFATVFVAGTGIHETMFEVDLFSEAETWFKLLMSIGTLSAMSFTGNGLIGSIKPPSEPPPLG